LRIPTISAFQNIESLDASAFDAYTKKHLYATLVDLGNELRVQGQCSARLSISKVEAGFLGGLGLDSDFYPYIPPCGIRDGLSAIRHNRGDQRPRGGPILLLGSAAHGVTSESMRWFARNARDRGLPDGVCVIAVGIGTDALLPPAEVPPGLELRGWMSQMELDVLLERASAAVIPQRLGFGALTRLPELACAGVPTIAFEHAVHAINPTPGLQTVDLDWNALCAAMEDAVAYPRAIDEHEYECWERAQPRPLARALARAARG
jgi:hypothetical protein